MAEKSTLDLLRDVNKDIDTANRTLDAAGRAVSGGAELFGFPSATAGKKAPASGTAPTGGLELQGVQGASVLESAVQTVGGKKYFSVPAPNGTRIIIPRQVSSTGQERYLGAHALESVINLMNGSEKCGNIVVLDESKRPSQKYYDIGPEGQIFLKGTNKEIKVYDQTTSTPSVPLSEKEFDILKKALSTQTNDVTHFKTTKDRGYAEDSTAEKGSWFSRNWWKILLGLVIAGGIAWGGVAIHNNRLKKKEKKAAQAAAAASNTNENANTNSSQNSSASTGTNTASALTGTNITNESANLTVTQNSGNSL